MKLNQIWIPTGMNSEVYIQGRKLMRLGCHLEIKKKCVLKSYKKRQPPVLKAKCTASVSHSKYRR